MSKVVGDCFTFALLCYVTDCEKLVVIFMNLVYDCGIYKKGKTKNYLSLRCIELKN